MKNKILNIIAYILIGLMIYIFAYIHGKANARKEMYKEFPDLQERIFLKMAKEAQQTLKKIEQSQAAKRKQNEK